MHLELDQFNLAQAADLTQANVGVQPGNILVPVSTQYALYPLENALAEPSGERRKLLFCMCGFFVARPWASMI